MHKKKLLMKNSVNDKRTITMSGRPKLNLEQRLQLSVLLQHVI